MPPLPFCLRAALQRCDALLRPHYPRRQPSRSLSVLIGADHVCGKHWLAVLRLRVGELRLCTAALEVLRLAPLPPPRVHSAPHFLRRTARTRRSASQRHIHRWRARGPDLAKHSGCGSRSTSHSQRCGQNLAAF
eukprot:2110258-Rhodomonas_salina.1